MNNHQSQVDLLKSKIDITVFELISQSDSLNPLDLLIKHQDTGGSAGFTIDNTNKIMDIEHVVTPPQHRLSLIHI